MSSWKERSSFNSKRSVDTEGNPSEVFEYKVVMVGTIGVGKTSVASRYVKDNFREYVNATIGASYMWRKERIMNKEVKFSLWDTAGQEQFHSLVPMYFRDSEAVILVVDVTRETCVDEANMWLEKVEQNAPPNTSVFLALNKIDMEDKRRFTAAQAEQFCQSKESHFQIRFCEVSAKTGAGVVEMFRLIGEVCLKKSESAAERGSRTDSIRFLAQGNVTPRSEQSQQQRKKNNSDKKGCPC
jgi:small GTP-binding protein